MNDKSQLLRNLADAGCSNEAISSIIKLVEAGRHQDALHEMKVCRCGLVEEMHSAQKKVDRLDFLIRKQEKQIQDTK